MVAVPAGQRPILVSDTTARGLAAGDPADAIPRSRALAAARRSSGADRLRAPARAKLGIDPVTGRMAWQLSLPSARPLADFLVTVDARTGELIRSRDVLQRATGSAMIYNPSPVTEQGGYDGLRDRKDHDSDLLTSLRLPVTLERITSAKGCLVGSYVDARVGKKAKSVCAPNLDFTHLTRSNDRFEAVMAYFHIDRERAYVDSLGLTEPLRGKPQKVRADGITEDNSFYSSKTRSLTLGSGGVDDGEDADVISHEYGHSLQDQATPGFGQTRQGATLGEGFGDYMAAAMSALTTGGSPFDTCIFDWDGVSYSRTGCGRLADRPQDLTTAKRKCDLEIHCVGQIWSSTLFRLREALGDDTAGHSVMDRVALEANFLLTPRSGFSDNAKALLAADRMLYGGAHAATIEAALIDREICKRSGC